MLGLLNESYRPRHVRQNILSSIIENGDSLVREAFACTFKEIWAAAFRVQAEGGRKEGRKGEDEEA